MIIDKLITQIDYISTRMFLKTWNDAFKTKDSKQIEQFLREEKTQKMLHKLTPHGDDFWFLHKNLTQYVYDNNVNMVKNLIAVGLDINLDNSLVSQFFQSVDRHTKQNVLLMAELLINSGLKLYDNNYQAWGISPIHNVLFDFQTYKYHEFNKSVPYLSEKKDKEFTENSVLYDILKLIKDKISHITLNDKENLVYLAIETKSQQIIKEIVEMPNMTYEYIQIGLEKAHDTEAQKIVDVFWANNEQSILENQITHSDLNLKKVKI